MDTPDKAAEIKAAAAALIAFGTALFGWVGWMVVLWLIAMALDYLTGTFAALYNKNLEQRGRTARPVAQAGQHLRRAGCRNVRSCAQARGR